MSRQRIRHFAVALVLSVILTAAGATSAPAGFLAPRAASSTSKAAQPAAAVPAAIAASIPGRGGREVFGFALASSLSDPTIGYASWNYDVLSTVAYFGLHVNTAGFFAGDNGWTVWNSPALTSLVFGANVIGH